MACHTPQAECVCLVLLLNFFFFVGLFIRFLISTPFFFLFFLLLPGLRRECFSYKFIPAQMDGTRQQNKTKTKGVNQKGRQTIPEKKASM